MGEDYNKKEVDLGRQLEEVWVGRSWVEVTLLGMGEDCWHGEAEKNLMA